MALIKIPYFTVNQYGQLTTAGEKEISTGGTVTWSSITGKPAVFPPSTHTHSIYDLIGFSPLNDVGTDTSVIADPYTNKLKTLKGTNAVTVSSDADSVTIDAKTYSVGVIDGVVPTFVDNGDGTGTFGACNVALYPSTDFTGALNTYSVPSATLSFTAGAQEYATINCNSCNPIWKKETDPSAINDSNNTLVYVVWRQDGGNLLHSSDQDSLGLGLPNKINTRMLFCEPYKVSQLYGVSNPVASETTTPSDRTIKVSSSIVFKGTVEQLIDAVDSSVDLLTKAVNTPGGWVYTTTPQYDNLHYNVGGGGETVLDNNKWTYRLYYRSVGDVKEVFYVESPAQYNTLALAREGSEIGRSDLPPILVGHCILVGRSLIQKGAATGITEPFVRTSGSFTTPVPIHNDLTGLQGGSAAEYYHLTAAEHAAITNPSSTFITSFMLMGA